jgi:DNA-binding MarR family transcriptional regulator
MAGIRDTQELEPTTDGRHTEEWAATTDTRRTDREPPLIGQLAELKVAISEELHRSLGEAGHPDLRPAHGCVFGFLREGGDRLTALADRSRLTKQAVGEAVADLERLGYVERVPDPSDRRAKIIRLTEKGEQATAAATEIFGDIERRLAAEVGEERFEEFRETLRHLYRFTRPRTAVHAF